MSLLSTNNLKKMGLCADCSHCQLCDGHHFCDLDFHTIKKTNACNGFKIEQKCSSCKHCVFEHAQIGNRKSNCKTYLCTLGGVRNHIVSRRYSCENYKKRGDQQ